MTSPKKPAEPTFGDVLRAVRNDFHETQEEFGRRFGVTGRTIHRYEQGHRSPTTAQATLFVERLRDTSTPRLTALAASAGLPVRLHAPVSSVAAPPPPPPSRPLADPFDVALWRAAEELEIPAHQARRVTAAVLLRARTAGLTLDDLLRAFGKREG